MLLYRKRCIYLEDIMDEKLLKLISDKPIVIPRILLNNYHKLNIQDHEFAIVIAIMSMGDKILYDPITISNELGIDKMQVMEYINDLVEKNILSIIIEKNNKKTTEYISLDMLYKKLLNIVIDNEEKEVPVDNSVFDIFQKELGKPLSPMQYEMIKEWITSGTSQELIIEALREAVLNGVNNFNYIDKIITSWKEKGYKTKEDIIKDKSKYHTVKKETKEIFDTDWLSQDE